MEDLEVNPFIQRDYSFKTGLINLSVGNMIPLYGSVHLQPGDRMTVVKKKWPKLSARVRYFGLIWSQ